MPFMFPVKPKRINESMLDVLDLSKYTMEVKLDGFRAMVESAGGQVRVFTRQKEPMVVPENLRPQLERLGLPDGTVLDAELWTPTKRGSWVQNPSVECVLSVWDVVSDGKVPMGPRPIEERREALKRLLGNLHYAKDIRIVVPEPVTKARVEEIRRIVEDHRAGTQSRSGFIHGVVLKRNRSPRHDHPNRSIEHTDWLKIVFNPT